MPVPESNTNREKKGTRRQRPSRHSILQELKTPLIIFAVFAGIGVWRWKATGHAFFLFNFGYIGSSILVGGTLSAFLEGKRKSWGRRITQLLIGLYMVGFLGLIARENMQIEGFFFYLFSGVFGGATLHYLIAKIAGPLHFGRAWCSWACWTAMVLDFLPWKRPSGRVHPRAGILRYLHFGIVLGSIAALFFLADYRPDRAGELTWLLVGNGFYYTVALLMAAILHDNRAFCKILCPVPVTQKILSPLAILKQEIDMDRCTECGLCERNCPMDVPLLHYASAGKRIRSSECILCNTCVDLCPAGAVRTTSRLFFS